MSLDKKMDKIRDLERQGNSDAALSEINELIDLHPNESEVWALRGFLYSAVRKNVDAIESVSKAIELSPEEATFYYARGRYHFRSDNLIDAARDFSDALFKYQRHDISFIQCLYFFRAETFIKLGKKQEALSDLYHVPDDHTWWTFKLRSKKDLIEDCSNL